MNEENQKKFKDPKIGICGFKNIGNTCYMNSILQLLIHSQTLINFFLCESNPFPLITNETQFVDLIIKDQIQAPFIKFLKECSIDRLGDIIRKHTNVDANREVSIGLGDFRVYLDNTLTIKIAEMTNTLIYLGSGCLVPIGFKKVIDRKIPSLRGFAQQDAHELLIGILDILIEETGIDSEPVINNVPTIIKEYAIYHDSLRKRIKNAQTLDEKKLIVEEHNQYRKDNWEIINKYQGLKYMTNVFGTKRKNSLDTSTTGYNPTIFNLLTFNMNVFRCLECDNTNYKFEYNTILSLDIGSTLDDCFKHFVREEPIERKCECCSSKKSTRKKIIWRPGMILFIQFCRFNHLPNGMVCKNNTNIEIPELIDISKYCDNTMGIDKSLTYKYKLKGISNHMGSLNGGHYTADAISIVDNKTWYHFDDSRVERHQSDLLDKSNGYILMYEMIDH